MDFVPYTGDNEDGSLKRPSEDELNALFEDKEKDVKWSKRTKALQWKTQRDAHGRCPDP